MAEVNLDGPKVSVASFHQFRRRRMAERVRVQPFYPRGIPHVPKRSADPCVADGPIVEARRRKDPPGARRKSEPRFESALRDRVKRDRADAFALALDPEPAVRVRRALERSELRLPQAGEQEELHHRVDHRAERRSDPFDPPCR